MYIVGQMAYGGEVSAAAEWNGPVQRMQLRPATEGVACLPPHMRHSLCCCGGAPGICNGHASCPAQDLGCLQSSHEILLA